MSKQWFLYFRIAFYAAVISLFVISPPSYWEGFSLCLYYNLFGFRCITCGMTRAFSNAMHLHFLKAVSFNPLILLIFPLFWIFAITDLYKLCRRSAGRDGFSLFEAIWSRIIRKP